MGLIFADKGPLDDSRTGGRLAEGDLGNNVCFADNGTTARAHLLPIVLDDLGRRTARVRASGRLRMGSGFWRLRGDQWLGTLDRSRAGWLQTGQTSHCRSPRAGTANWRAHAGSRGRHDGGVAYRVGDDPIVDAGDCAATRQEIRSRLWGTNRDERQKNRRKERGHSKDINETRGKKRCRMGRVTEGSGGVSTGRFLVPQPGWPSGLSRGGIRLRVRVRPSTLFYLLFSGQFFGCVHLIICVIIIGQIDCNWWAAVSSPASSWTCVSRQARCHCGFCASGSHLSRTKDAFRRQSTSFSEICHGRI